MNTTLPNLLANKAGDCFMAGRVSDWDAVNSMLEFYGVQLQSHAGLVLASVVGFFIVVQVWVAVRPPSILFLVILPLSMALSVLGAVYSLMRLWVYGKLATAILSGNQKEFEEVCRGRKEYFPHAQVSAYGNVFFDKHYSDKLWYRLFNANKQPNRLLLGLTFGFALTMSYLLVSG